MIWLILALVAIASFGAGCVVGARSYASKLPQVLAQLEPEAITRLARRTRAFRELDE